MEQLRLVRKAPKGCDYAAEKALKAGVSRARGARLFLHPWALAPRCVFFTALLGYLKKNTYICAPGGCLGRID